MFATIKHLFEVIVLAWARCDFLLQYLRYVLLSYGDLIYVAITALSLSIRMVVLIIV